MSLNIICYAKLKLYNSEGKYVKEDFVCIPLLQTPTSILSGPAGAYEEDYFTWLKQDKSHWIKKHLKNTKKKLKDLRSAGYSIHWEVQ